MTTTIHDHVAVACADHDAARAELEAAAEAYKGNRTLAGAQALADARARYHDTYSARARALKARRAMEQKRREQ